MQSKAVAASAVARAEAVDPSAFDLAQEARLAANDNYVRLIHDDPEDIPRQQRQQAFRGTELHVDIPADKAAARAWLDSIGIGASVSLSAACAKADLPLDHGWRGDIRPPHSPSPWQPRKRKAAANSNEPISWPLLETLRRDRREDDIPYVQRYWALCGAAATSPYTVDAGTGTDVEGMGIEMRSLRLSGVAFDRSFAKMTATELPGGYISYRERRHTVQQSIVSVGQRTMISDEEGQGRSQAPLRLAFAAGSRVDQLDSIPVLMIIRKVLDVDPFDDGVPLLPLFDDAVLGRVTLTFIGGTLKFKHKARSAEAKRRIYTAIDIVRDEWRLIERYMAETAAACDRRVEARRREIAADRAAYLGVPPFAVSAVEGERHFA